MAVFVIESTPVDQLDPNKIFPPVALAEPNGLLAVGGDLSVERLLAAYRAGIFPWYSEMDPLMWWSPNPRMILLPDQLHVSRSLRKLIRKKPFKITINRAFDQVIRACSQEREESGTWIIPEMIDAYVTLHNQGYALSVEAWQHQPDSPPQLVGGAYGVCIGKAFFGESMFYRAPNASKVAFVYLVQHLHQHGYTLIDCQMNTDHLTRFGAFEVPRSAFLKRLNEATNITSQ
ncbi:MAG: leucyl/phenylalanyl-tRNA--protein transferase [Magnetococcales bacterium]|nr:leucyl/phenylalanyl-tRNA--protein transferase [Magnetococcales bacterium]